MPEHKHLDPAVIVAHLAATRLFALLDPEDLALLARLFRAVSYRPGQLIARQGECDATLWIAVEGQLSFDRRENDHIRHLGLRGYGTVIGERGVFTGERRANSVLPIEPTTLLYVDGEALWAALSANPKIFDRLVLPEAVRARLVTHDAEASVEGERRVALYRRHWLVLLRGMLMPLVLSVVMGVISVNLVPLTASPAVILAVAFVATILPMLGAIWAFFDYRYDCLIVTNRRVIHIERTPFIDARRSEAPLARIQDVQIVTPSLTARLWGFGHITIQTAGTRGAIRFTSVPHPDVVRETIFEQADRAQEYARRERLAWIAGQIRVALGRGAPQPNTTKHQEDTTSGLEADDETGVIPAFVRVPVKLVSSLLPKMRLQDGECVTWRKHWWILLRHTWFLLLPWLALTAALGAGLLGRVTWPWQWLLFAWALLLMGLMWQIEDWRNDLYQLTNEHIIDVECLPLGFFADRRQAKLSQIQDIRYTVPNPLANLLNYGNVTIETAAESGNFGFDYVYNPAGVQEEIFARLEQQRSRAQQAEEERRAEEMTRWLAQYHRVVSESGGEGSLPPVPPGPRGG